MNHCDKHSHSHPKPFCFTHPVTLLTFAIFRPGPSNAKKPPAAPAVQQQQHKRPRNDYVRTDGSSNDRGGNAHRGGDRKHNGHKRHHYQKPKTG
jgi:hypothetical protein